MMRKGSKVKRYRTVVWKRENAAVRVNGIA